MGVVETMFVKVIVVWPTIWVIVGSVCAGVCRISSVGIDFAAKAVADYFVGNTFEVNQCALASAEPLFFQICLGIAADDEQKSK